ncbi:MAG: molybdopterin cofactor-binding domain-containing protein, partial [Pseudomonadota bacterium]
EPPLTYARGDVHAALDAAEHRLTGQLEIGGQEHFYLEGQAAAALPGEIEINPLICGPGGAVAADALIRTGD